MCCFNLSDNSKYVPKEINYLKDIVNKIQQDDGGLDLLDWLTSVTQFYLDQTTIHWRMFAYTGIVMLCLMLPMFTYFLPPLTFKRKQILFIKKGTKNKKGEM